MSCGEGVFTCLAAISFPRGIGTPFSVAMRFSVARAFSWFPVSTSYRALSGSHWQQPKHIVTARALIHNIVLSKKQGMERHTHKAQDGKDEEGDGGQAQQPAPAQSGHHQDGQEDLKHGAQSPKYLQNRSIFSKHC